jgi:hypothetical protein
MCAAAEPCFGRLSPSASTGLGGLTVDALVDSGSEPILPDAWIADALELDLSNGTDDELIGIRGQAVLARFVAVTLYLHRWDELAESIGWRADVGFVTPWRPLYIRSSWAVRVPRPLHRDPESARARPRHRGSRRVRRPLRRASARSLSPRSHAAAGRLAAYISLEERRDHP